MEPNDKNSEVTTCFFWKAKDIPAGIYLLKRNNKNTGPQWEYVQS